MFRYLAFLLIFSALGWLGYRDFFAKPYAIPADARVREEPYQKRIYFGKRIRVEGHSLNALARYRLRGVVVNVAQWGRSPNIISGLSSMDIGMVWGLMSSPKYLSKFHFSTSDNGEGRGLRVLRTEDTDIPIKILRSQISNTHIISSSPMIDEALAKIKVGDVAVLSGYLVEGEGWRSSLSRDDEAVMVGTDCEIMVVTDVATESSPPAKSD